ncbi:magnesium/cobalt transporter CorA [Gaiella sp.]|uniref:magnesium/cobalt transporter CorA n=1 Tax=Gaiella sp. TaxID=2663207 RepID=UPI003983878C
MSIDPDAPDPGNLLHCSAKRRLQIERDRVHDLLADGEFFWLDLHDPEVGDLEILRDEFGFHPLSLEDSWRFDQRPKIDEYDDYVFLVVFGASSEDDSDGLVEVHCFYSDRFLVTVHRDAAPSLAALRERYVKRDAPVDDPARLMHAVVDGLVDSFFPRLETIDDRIDALEDEIFRDAGDAALQEIFAMKRTLVTMRKVIAPQRDLFSSIVVGVESFPGMTDDDQRYFRDVYDHLIRIGDMVDTYRDLLTGAMDVYLSTVSNRLNVVMKQLAIIATVFMPLTFLTGFFGQNLGWLVANVGGLGHFLVFGIGLELMTLAIVVGYFFRRGWLGR